MKKQDAAMAAASSAVEAAEEEEFSFHRVNTGPLVHCSIDSPPLWHLSPAKGEEIDRDEDDDDDHHHHHHHLESKAVTECSKRKSFSCIEGRRCRKMADEEEEEDQKMDLLWENFNEELRKSRLLQSDNKSPHHNDDDRIPRMGSCVQALKVPKNMNSTTQLISRTRKPGGGGGGGGGGGSLVIINFLKKLFLLHHSSRKLKTSRSW